MSTEGIPHCRRGSACATVCVALLLLWIAPLTHAAVLRSELTLLGSALERISASARVKELFFQLPEHVTAEGESELRLVLRASPSIPAHLFTVTLSLNGVMVLKRTPDAPDLPTNRVDLTASVPERLLQPGWNRLELTFGPPDLTQDILAKESWLISKSDCKLSFTYSRLPMFSELARFPASFGEEKLLQPGATVHPSAVTLVLPKILRDVHLRACAIIGARLGQIGYLRANECDLILTNLTLLGPGNGNLIVVGDWREVSQSPILTNFSGLTKPLRSGEGVVAEAIVGSDGGAHRCLLISGSDDAGVEKALLTVGSSTALDSIGPSPAAISAAPSGGKNTNAKLTVSGLNEAAKVLVPDEQLERMAFVVPLTALPGELRTLLTLAFFCGSRLPASPALLPEVCGYDLGDAPSAARLRDKSVVLLGSAKQWRFARRSRHWLPVEVPDPLEKNVRMQGRYYPLEQFEPTLTLLQLNGSPWSKGDVMLVAGGWESFDSPTLTWILTDPDAPAKVFGNVAAMDGEGRIVCYDTRHAAADSLAERLGRHVPRGLSLAETDQRAREYRATEDRSHRINSGVFYFCGALLTIFVALRLLLLWDRARRRQKTMRSEKPLLANP